MIAFASFFSAELLAADKIPTQQTDTTEYQTPEVRVTADRIQTSPITKFSSSYYLDNKQVQSIGAMQANELLSKSPGIYIKNYGGAGGLKSLSIRGTNSSQNLIMIDGIALNSSQNAMYDISLFPTSFINSMEVVRGGASDTYGANALGGVVNFITEANPKNNQFSAKFSTASYDEYKLSADYAFKSNSFYSIIGGEYYNSKGNYEFEFNQNGKTTILNRDNAAFENIALNLDIQMDEFMQVVITLTVANDDKIEHNGTVGLILCHGYSTASSIADTVNHILNQHVFDGMDMEVQVSIDKMCLMVDDYLRRKAPVKELMLLVDMGSLEDIYERINPLSDCNIGIINNVSTASALEVGNLMKQHMHARQIIKTIKEKHIDGDNKEKAEMIFSVHLPPFEKLQDDFIEKLFLVLNKLSVCKPIDAFKLF